MSKITTQRINCDCGQEIQVEQYDSINHSFDPHLTSKLLNNELTTCICPKCKKTLNLVYPILFNKGFGSMIQFYPYEDIDKVKKQTEKVSNEFKNILSQSSPFAKIFLDNKTTIWTQDFQEFKNLISEKILNL